MITWRDEQKQKPGDKSPQLMEEFQSDKAMRISEVQTLPPNDCRAKKQLHSMMCIQRNESPRLLQVKKELQLDKDMCIFETHKVPVNDCLTKK
jgi:hypothetical protein